MCAKVFPQSIFCEKNALFCSILFTRSSMYICWRLLSCLYIYINIYIYIVFRCWRSMCIVHHYFTFPRVVVVPLFVFMPEEELYTEKIVGLGRRGVPSGFCYINNSSGGGEGRVWCESGAIYYLLPRWYVVVGSFFLRGGEICCVCRLLA